jgi:transposase
MSEFPAPPHLLALHVTLANVGDRAAVVRLAAGIQDATGDNVALAYVDQGYTGEAAADAAEGIALHVVKLREAKHGFVLLPRRWVVERSFAWATRCSRLVKDYERYATILAGFHVITFVGYMLEHVTELMQSA